MKRARLLALGLLLALIAPAASGCELVADFDRGKIPKPAPDGGSGGDADASFVPPAPVPDGGGPVPDAGPPALDAGGAVSDGAVPPPPPDAG